ncbi:alpha/beta fold hydrolase [Viridibacillus arvi]|uniref:alpha/beta fold hydrolase n=1 Tax=Viridibacillus arvi TaxID=263475 RepID=UPI003D2A3BB5
MRKIFKVLKKLFVLFIILMILVTVSIFTYHNYLLKKESALIKNAGTLVDFNSKKINVYIEGRGEDTYIFMPGSGVAAPVYEMKGLYSKFSKENKIAVINRAGYGHSDVFNDNRNIDTILEQTRSSLIQSGNKPPYILVPHSLSGLEAIYWAQKYPNEVKGIIALDIGLPKQYVTHKMSLVDSLTVRGMNLLSKMGFHRLFPSLTFNPEVIKQSFLTEHEKEVFKAISYKQFFNNNMEQELLQVYENGKKSVALPIPTETPILFLDAITEENKNSKYTKQKNKDYKEFAEQLLISDVITMEGKHSIYLYSPDDIYNLAKDFINNKVEKD